ncbi:MAG: CopG family transcriptional regulator [Cyanobacteria bacterium P01_A01_bin.40]
MPENKGFDRVSESPRNKGQFTSPNDEPLGKPIGVRLPASLEAWISEEAEKQGTNKGNLIRHLLAAYRTQQSA